MELIKRTGNLCPDMSIYQNTLQHSSCALSIQPLGRPVGQGTHGPVQHRHPRPEYSLVPRSAKKHLLTQPLTSTEITVSHADMKCSGDVVESLATVYMELE